MENLSLTKPTMESYLVTNFSAGNFCEEKARRDLEKKYSEYLEVTDKFSRQSVSYQLSKKEQLHSWLKYKEGFSADLVNVLLNEMGIKSGDLIMDPFTGTGTTGIVCQNNGINSIGYDIMPVSSVAIQAKEAVLRYDLSEIEHLLEDVRKMKVPENYDKKTSYIVITQDAYPEETEVFLQYITDWNDSSAFSKEAKNLLRLCIINSLERSSYTIKSGQYLSWDYRSKKVKNANEKRKEKGQKPLPEKCVRAEIHNIQETIVDELKHVLNDIRIMQKNTTNVEKKAKFNYVQNSVLFEIPKLEDCILDGVITSPPYCNRYDYTRTYALELVYLGLDEYGIKQLRQELLSCTVENHSKMERLKEFYKSIGQGERYACIKEKIQSNKALSEIIVALKKRKKHGDLNNNGVIRMVEGYFAELGFIYAELYRLCKKGAMVAFVNDNVRYGGEVIPVDFLSSSLAEQFGFKVRKIYTLKQQKGNSSQQMAKFGRVALRKGITVWEKV